MKIHLDVQKMYDLDRSVNEDHGTSGVIISSWIDNVISLLGISDTRLFKGLRAYDLN